MPWTTNLPILLWGLIILPLAILFWLRKPADKLTTIVYLLDFALVNLLCALFINWSYINYWLRLLAFILPIALIIQTFLRYRGFYAPFLPPKTTPNFVFLGVGLVILGVAAFLNIRAFQSFSHGQDEQVLGLFPVRKGLYVIVNGGNGPTGFGMNDHTNPLFSSNPDPDESMAYALDVMRMGIRGNIRQGGNYQRSYLKYVGYNDLVYSPCVGQVVYVEAGHPEVEVFQQGAPLGNYVVIQCAEYFITLGNLRDQGIDVKVGEQVSFERIIGRVGNSGTPSIPHLHIHATKGGWKPGEGQPVPIVFPGTFAVNRFLVRNDLTISNKEGPQVVK